MKRNLEFEIGGMTCAGCVRRIEARVSSLEGVERVAVNLVTRRATVDLGTSVQGIQFIVDAIESLGFQVRPVPTARASEPADEVLPARRAFLVSLVIALPLFVLGMSHGLIEFASTRFAMTVQFVLATFLTFGPARRFFIDGWRAVRSKSPDMSTLVALGVGASYAYSTVAFLGHRRLPGAFEHVYFESGGGIIVFVLLGRWLESRARMRLVAAVHRLMSVRPSVARRRVDGEIAEVDVERIAVGDILVVGPGESIAADGVIVAGETSVDESILTGESMPVDKRAGDEVSGGTANRQGRIDLRVIRVGAESLLARIGRAVADAQGSKAPISRLADRVSAVFVPVVLVIASAAAILWYLVDPSAHGITVAVERFVAVLVIACPCALGLATPAAIAAATGRGAEFGILFRGGEALEAASRVDTVVFDKTGTLTEGRPAVMAVMLVQGASEQELIRHAAGAEAASEHPLAKAIVNDARERGIEFPEAAMMQAAIGAGVTAVVGDHSVVVGSRRLLLQRGIVVGSPLAEEARQAEDSGWTTVFVVVDGRLMGAIALADRLASEAPEVVAALRGLGIRIVMASGDRRPVAETLARTLAIHDVHAELTPVQKVDVVASLVKEGRRVAMVGDGINDAPALAAAQVGVAVGRAVDIAAAAADVILLSGGVRGLVGALSLARVTMRVIRQNLAWAFAYNVIGIPLAAGVLIPFGGNGLDPLIASAAMSLSSVSVILSSLRLRRARV